MYLTQNAQILAEHMPSWNHENHHDKLTEKSPLKKWPGQVGSEISDQVCLFGYGKVSTRMC